MDIPQVVMSPRLAAFYEAEEMTGVVSVVGIELFPTLFGRMNCSPSGSSVRGISRVEMLEQVAIAFSRGSS